MRTRLRLATLAGGTRSLQQACCLMRKATARATKRGPAPAGTATGLPKSTLETASFRPKFSAWPKGRQKKAHGRQPIGLPAGEKEERSLRTGTAGNFTGPKKKLGTSKQKTTGSEKGNRTQGTGSAFALAASSKRRVSRSFRACRVSFSMSPVPLFRLRIMRLRVFFRVCPLRRCGVWCLCAFLCWCLFWCLGVCPRVAFF